MKQSLDTLIWVCHAKFIEDENAEAQVHPWTSTIPNIMNLESNVVPVHIKCTPQPTQIPLMLAVDETLEYYYEYRDENNDTDQVLFGPKSYQKCTLYLISPIAEQ